MNLAVRSFYYVVLLGLCISLAMGFHSSLRPFPMRKARHFEQAQLQKERAKSFNFRVNTRLNENPNTFTNESALIPVDLNEELRVSFMSYAFSTILGRALPDSRDGLKPVHRRVLYAMKILGLTPDSSYRKCARIVGEVLGKYHPHGDQSVYDALVRMAQDFVMMHPLIAGHGNFGSIDNDPPAAMRYTEAKLSNLAFDALLADIDEDTVDFIPNFDGNEIEPLVLPARLPILLINGASGIAVGMATNIPPHNLNEIVDGMIALIDNPQLSTEDLMKIIPAPDFPTGGEIIGLKGAKDFIEKGSGSITIRGKTIIEKAASNNKSSNKTKTTIIISELPYMTNKAAFLEKVAEMVNDKKLEGISDLRDESDRDGVRVVIELKRDALPEIVLNNLFLKTGLQVNFPGNMVTLTQNGTQPNRINLKEALQSFIQFRFETIRRRSKHQLQKLSARDHIVLGLIQALRRIDEIIAITKTSNDTNNARQKLMNLNHNSNSDTNNDGNSNNDSDNCNTNGNNKIGFSYEQAEAILSLTLRRLTAMEEKKLLEEHEDLSQRIIVLEKILREDKDVFKIMKAESAQLKKKYGVPRRSTIRDDDDAKELSHEDLLANSQSIIILTESGYIKRIPVSEFVAQSRGGRGKAGAKLSGEEDVIAHFITCKDHDNIIFISDNVVAYGVKAYQVPLSSRTAKGTPIPNVLKLKTKEKITAFFAVDKFDEKESLLLLTEKGFSKKLPLNRFLKIQSSGLQVITLEENDNLRWARRCRESDGVVIVTRKGFAGRFNSDAVRVMGRATRGVLTLKLREGDSIADCEIIPSDSVDSKALAVVVTDKGFGKRVDLFDVREAGRRCKGVTLIKFKRFFSEGEDNLRSVRVYRSEKDELVLSTSKGTITRIRVNDIRVTNRNAQGSKLQNIPSDDFLSNVDIVPYVEEGDESGKEENKGDPLYWKLLLNSDEKPPLAKLPEEPEQPENDEAAAEEEDD